MQEEANPTLPGICQDCIECCLLALELNGYRIVPCGLIADGLAAAVQVDLQIWSLDRTTRLVLYVVDVEDTGDMKLYQAKPLQVRPWDCLRVLPLLIDQMPVTVVRSGLRNRRPATGSASLRSVFGFLAEYLVRYTCLNT